jgi:hypothetical protein
VPRTHQNEDWVQPLIFGIVAVLVVGGFVRSIFGRFAGSGILGFGAGVLGYVLVGTVAALVIGIIAFLVSLLSGAMPGRGSGWSSGHGWGSSWGSGGSFGLGRQLRRRLQRRGAATPAAVALREAGDGPAAYPPPPPHTRLDGPPAVFAAGDVAYRSGDRGIRKAARRGVAVCYRGRAADFSAPQGDYPRQRAREVFGRLEVWDTTHNSGVLIYLQLVDRSIEILADRGISAKVDQATWDGVCRRMGDRVSRRSLRSRHGRRNSRDHRPSRQALSRPRASTPTSCPTARWFFERA